MKWDKVIDTFEAEFDMCVFFIIVDLQYYSYVLFRVAYDGTKLLIRTNENAPQYKVIAIDLANTKRDHVDVIPEDKDAHLEDVTAVNKDRLAVVYKRNVSIGQILTDMFLTRANV